MNNKRQQPKKNWETWNEKKKKKMKSGLTFCVCLCILSEGEEMRMEVT